MDYKGSALSRLREEDIRIFKESEILTPYREGTTLKNIEIQVFEMPKSLYKYPQKKRFQAVK